MKVSRELYNWLSGVDIQNLTFRSTLESSMSEDLMISKLLTFPQIYKYTFDILVQN